MNGKSLLLGIVVLLACLAGWLINSAAGQPEPQRVPGPANPVSATRRVVPPDGPLVSGLETAAA